MGYMCCSCLKIMYKIKYNMPMQIYVQEVHSYEITLQNGKRNDFSKCKSAVRVLFRESEWEIK